MWLDLLYLLGGILFLLFGGDFLVKSSVSLAQSFKVSSFLIGSLVVSVGTSFPELVVSVQSAFVGHPDIALGNVVGSNIANIALGLGLVAIFFPVIIKKKSVFFDWIILFVLSVLIVLFSLNGRIQRIEGLILLLIVGYYIFNSIRRSNKAKKAKQMPQNPQYKPWIALLILIISIVVLGGGAQLIIFGGSSLALHLGVEERIVSLTVIAFGTSLPEITTSVIASYRKHSELAIGNIIGSNIFNIAIVLGITTFILPIQVNVRFLSFDYYWMMGFTLILLLPIFVKGKITKLEALLMVSIYSTYIYLLFF